MANNAGSCFFIIDIVFESEEHPVKRSHKHALTFKNKTTRIVSPKARRMEDKRMMLVMRDPLLMRLETLAPIQRAEETGGDQSHAFSGRLRADLFGCQPTFNAGNLHSAHKSMEMGEREIQITGDNLLSDIQAIFNGLYPYLMIELLPTNNDKERRKNRTSSTGLFINELTAISVPCTIDFSSTRTVRELTQDFKQNLGIIVQLLRKSGNVWNIISLTGEWTLGEQNNAGEEISALMHR